MTARPYRGPSVTGVALKIAGALLAAYFARDAWIHREAEQLQTLRLERELDEKHQWRVNHDVLRASLPEMQAVLSRLVQRLPAKFDAPAIENSLRVQATQAGIAIAALQIGKQRAREGFYAELPVDLIVQGSAPEFMKFMNGLPRESPLRQVAAMKIEPGADKGMLRAALTVDFYRYIEY